MISPEMRNDPIWANAYQRVGPLTMLYPYHADETFREWLAEAYVLGQIDAGKDIQSILEETWVP